MVVLFVNVFAPVDDGKERFRMPTNQNYRPMHIRIDRPK